MNSDSHTEHELAAFLRELLARGLTPDQDSLHSVRAALGDVTAGELAERLRDTDDAEACPMRELLLFPDATVSRAVEAWLLERHQTPPALRREVLTAALQGAEARLHLGEGVTLLLELDKAEAGQFVSRLHPHTPAPEEVVLAVREAARELGTEAAEDHVALAVLSRCRRARFSWTPEKQRFMADLARGLARGVPGGPASGGAELAPRLREAVDWSVLFLERAGDDVHADLALHREELLEQLQQAHEMERMRAKYNFETRRMLGMAETFTNPEALRWELALLDDVLRATGGAVFGARPQVVHRDLADGESLGDVRDVEDMRRLLGLLGGE